MNTQIVVQVYGEVQGVWFRRTVQEIAEQFDFVGYVKNNEDGTVEIVACGNEECFEEFLELVQVGSPLSDVDDIEYDIIGICESNYEDFSII